MTRVLTYLRMDEHTRLTPGRPFPGLALRQEPDLRVVRALHREIGAAHRWARCFWNDDQWDAWLGSARRDQYVLTLDGLPAGAVELERHTDGATEISVFGLLPEHIGRGLGGHALTLAVRAAWRRSPDGRRPTSVWLYTTDLDHPSALRNYLRRGFGIDRRVIA
ncbi:GNAT family N-acetyltransferase [Actinocorallia lasiicapitis]